MAAVSLTRSLRPPGPSSLPIIGQTLSLARDPLGFLRHCSEQFGDLVSLRIRGLEVVLVTSPGAIADILIKNHRDYTVDRLSRSLGDALGNSLLVSDGQDWERHRRLVQPSLYRSRVKRHAQSIVAITEEHVRDWADREVIDIYAMTMWLALDVFSRTLLNCDVSGHQTRLHHDLNLLMRHVLGIASSGLRVPLGIPTPTNLAARRAIKDLDTIIAAIIDDHRSAGHDSDDLVSALIRARYDSGCGMSDQQIRDELLTMLLVGHETTALALTFAFWLLARHPAIYHRMSSEVATVVGNRRATIEDVDHLRFTEAVWKEALRLYPPVWAMGREALHDCELGGYRVSAGTQMLLSPWVSHRNSRYFPNPDDFRPERWLDRLDETLPQFSYFPFGGGPRMCVGYSFARIESLLILVSFAQRFTLESGSAQTLDLLPTVTLRPAGPVNITFRRRKPTKS